MKTAPKNILSGLLILNLWLFSHLSTAGPGQPIRVRFERGAITARVKGQLTPQGAGGYYVVSARAGQHMVVHTASLTPGLSTLAQVRYPSGKQDGEKGPVSFNQTLTETGDYYITVSVNLMAAEKRTGPFLLEVIIW